MKTYNFKSCFGGLTYAQYREMVIHYNGEPWEFICEDDETGDEWELNGWEGKFLDMTQINRMTITEIDEENCKGGRLHVFLVDDDVAQELNEWELARMVEWLTK